MTRLSVPAAVLAALLASSCASPEAPTKRPDVVPLGTHFDSAQGSVCIIKIQDDYRLIRCIPSGPIAGCYEDLLIVHESDVKFNRWMPVEKVPGLDVSIVSPREVAFRLRTETGTPQK